MESKVQLKTEIHVKRHKLELLRDLAEYSCKRMDSKTWIGSSRFVLNQLREEGCDYPEYQMYEAYILHMEEKDEQAREILKKFKHQNFVRESGTGRCLPLSLRSYRIAQRQRTGDKTSVQFLSAEGRQFPVV